MLKQPRLFLLLFIVYLTTFEDLGWKQASYVIKLHNETNSMTFEMKGSNFEVQIVPSGTQKTSILVWYIIHVLPVIHFRHQISTIYNLFITLLQKNPYFLLEAEQVLFPVVYCQHFELDHFFWGFSHST